MTKRQAVLFVDDEPAVLEALRGVLRKEPYAILTANSAERGLRALSFEHVDVVVADEQMPGMPGSEFLSVVRARHPKTMRILLTGNASMEGVIRAINEGEIYRFLAKPFSPAQLAHTIREALALGSLGGAVSRAAASARREQLDALELENPGITRVPRTLDGCILLDEPDTEVDLACLARSSA